MKQLIYRIYATLFANLFFRKMNLGLFYLSIRGLGILNCYGEKLSGEHFLLKKVLKNAGKKVMIDVGANVGNYSLLAKEINNSTIIHAVEPMPVNYKKLCDGVANHNDIHTYNLAIGKQKEKLSIYDYGEENSEHASLYKEVITELHDSKTLKEYVVDVVSLDEFCDVNNIDNIHLLKIDTEGNEYNILLGAKKLLSGKRIDIIHIEFNEMNVVSRVFFRDFYTLLDNYSFYRLLPNSALPIKKYTPIQHELFGFQNIVAVRKELKLF